MATNMHRSTSTNAGRACRANARSSRTASGDITAHPLLARVASSAQVRTRETRTPPVVVTSPVLTGLTTTIRSAVQLTPSAETAATWSAGLAGDHREHARVTRPGQAGDPLGDRELELHQRVDRLRRRIEDVDQALVRAGLELLARLLVDVRAAQHRVLVDARRQRDRSRHARAGAHRGIDDLASALVEQLEVVRLHADADLLRCEVTQVLAYSMISATTPEPTVRPPSRIANRCVLSIAIGVISSTVISTLSPGITISVPLGRFATPVTSVVRK